MAFAPPARHLLRAKDLADARYSEPHRGRRHGRRGWRSPRRTSAGSSAAPSASRPHHYLLTRRLERAAALLRMTDWSVAEVCVSVGLRSVGSFTTSFKRAFGQTPTEYRAKQPPAALAARVPSCVLRTYLRPETARFKKTGTDSRIACRRRTIRTKEHEMAIKVSNAQLWVHDQEEALDFWTKKVGFEVRADISMPELGDFRWLTVGAPGQEDFSIALLAIPGPPVMDEGTKKQVEELMAKGFSGSVFLNADDVQASYEELKGRGVEFTEAPVRAALRDRLRVSRSRPATRFGSASRPSPDQLCGSRRISRPALCAPISESACCSVTARVADQDSPGPRRAPQRQQLHRCRGDVGPGGAAEARLSGDHDVDPLALRREFADGERLGPGDRHLDGSQPLPHSGRSRGIRRAAAPAVLRAHTSRREPSRPAPCRGHRRDASALRAGRSSPGPAAPTAPSPPAGRRSVWPAGSSAVATTTGRSGP